MNVSKLSGSVAALVGGAADLYHCCGLESTMTVKWHVSSMDQPKSWKFPSFNLFAT